MAKLTDIIKNNSARTFKVALQVFIVSLAILPTAYFYAKYTETQNKINNPNEAARNESKELVGRVGKLIELPSGEEPTIATVSDSEKLKSNPFFDVAQNGDKLLIYPNAKRAYLYRPSWDKILNVTTVNIGNGQDGQVAGTTTTNLKVALYNGTQDAGATSKAETMIKDKKLALEVTSRVNASKNDYANTVVIDVTGKNADYAKTVATALNAQVVALPSGEVAPQSDLLIIVGSNLK